MGNVGRSDSGKCKLVAVSRTRCEQLLLEYLDTGAGVDRRRFMSLTPRSGHPLPPFTTRFIREIFLSHGLVTRFWGHEAQQGGLCAAQRPPMRNNMKSGRVRLVVPGEQ